MSMLVELINISKRNSLLALTQDAGSMDISVDFLLQTVYTQKNGVDGCGRAMGRNARLMTEEAKPFTKIALSLAQSTSENLSASMRLR